MIHTHEGTVVVMHVGGWTAPYGITLAVDMLSSVMLVLAGLLALTVSVYACFDLDEARVRFGFFPGKVREDPQGAQPGSGFRTGGQEGGEGGSDRFRIGITKHVCHEVSIHLLAFQQ